ncbi:MAG: Nif3-like dinuclear metal center hexameric protein [Candidatus Pacebacteria bacterium]|nr:Nif3-like dinuclear metal center hexameric protein [Candidatus Paceibacterota bacterium]
MEKLNKIVNFLDDYLKIKEIEDDSWNGLQIKGKDNVKKIAFCVTAGADVFKKTLKEKPDLIIVHHGIFWKKGNPSVRGFNQDRIKILLNNNISLYASHLPLDKHLIVGNNVQLLKLFKAKPKELLGGVGYISQEKKVKLKEIIKKLEKELKTKCIVLNYGKEIIKKIGIVSGGAPWNVFEAIEKRVDLYITGDSADVTETVKDAKINVIFAGHYATETLGLKALAKLLKKKFKIETVFIDFPTRL